MTLETGKFENFVPVFFEEKLRRERLQPNHTLNQKPNCAGAQISHE